MYAFYDKTFLVLALLYLSIQIPSQVIEDVELEVEIVKATEEKDHRGKMDAIREELSKIKEEKEEAQEQKLEPTDGVVCLHSMIVHLLLYSICFFCSFVVCCLYLELELTLQAHSIDEIVEEAPPAATVVEDDLMVDMLEKEAVLLKKKIEVEVDERGTVCTWMPIFIPLINSYLIYCFLRECVYLFFKLKLPILIIRRSMRLSTRPLLLRRN
jgi:hypothetical protein